MVSYENVNWFQLVQCRIQWPDVLSTVMRRRVQCKMGNALKLLNQEALLHDAC
jgi:hypothetical protein